MRRGVQTGVTALLCTGLLLNGGCTAALWRSVNPNEPLWVPCSEVREEQLQARGAKYKKTRLLLAEPVEGYVVEKTGGQKLCDCVVLVAAMPFTLAADVVLIGFLGDPAGFLDALINH